VNLVVDQLMLAAKDPLGHNYDYPILSINGWAILTNHMLMMIGVTIFMLWWLPRVGRSVDTGSTGTSHDYVTKGWFAHMVEVICVFFRDDIARPVMGHFTDRYIPFIWTIFFFILFNNLIGLFPLMDITALAAEAFSGGDEAHPAQVEAAEPSGSAEGEEHIAHAQGEEPAHAEEHSESAETGGDAAHAGEHHVIKWGPFVLFQDLRQEETASHFHGIGGTPTGNIAVTGALAILAIIAVIGAAISNLGVVGFLHHLTLDAPVALWPLTVFLEVVGLAAKTFALMVRLFANMTAGHVMLAALVGFASMAWNGFVHPPAGEFSIGGLIGFVPVSIASIAFATAIGVLEVLVAFIQAFVFAFLTTMFISMFLPHEHEHEHEHEHDHEHAHGHAPGDERSGTPQAVAG